MPDPPNAADKDLANACREWIKGCTCAPADSPQECKECTDAFLAAVLTRAKNHGLKVGANAMPDPTQPAGAYPAAIPLH
jgi:hypothetical protein